MSSTLRPTRMEVSLDNLKHNFREFKGFVRPSCRVIPVVKANAYGVGVLGAVEALRSAGADFFAVATPDEALELREAGANEKILVLGASPFSSAADLVGLDISAAVTDIRMARAMSEAAVRLKKMAYVHIKIDSGMGRIGFLPNAAFAALDEIKNLPGLVMEGIFTHFATADETNLDFTRLQFSRFHDLLDKLNEKGITFKMRHCCNSAGIMNLPEFHLDAVRPGVSLYGMYPSEDTKKSISLKPVFEVKTAIAALRELPVGSGVSYGLRYMTRGNEKIAALPVGYADGYTRLLSGKGTQVLIRGKRCPIVGTICMDQTMVNVSHLNEVEVGDEVVLVGKQGDEYIPPEELAKILGTINYEIPLHFSRRVPRVYKQ